MGTVPVVNISPLTITQSDEPRLEPLVPVARIESPSASTDETYSPSGEPTASGSADGESEDRYSEDRCDDSAEDTQAQHSSNEPSETQAIDLFA